MAAVSVITGPDGGRTEPTLPVRVITPHSGLEGFRSALRSLVVGFPAARHLARRFFVRDMRADYRQSVLGYVWLVVPALANVVVWTFLNSENVIRVDSGAVPYAVFVLSGTILWTAFNGSVMGMLSLVNAARGLFSKVNFPHESLVYSAFLKVATDALLASAILIPALLIYNVTPTREASLFPVALLAALLLGTAAGLLLVPVASLYSDVSRAVQIVLRFGFFVTPVIFPLPAAGLARRLMLANPITPVIVSGRSFITGSGETMATALASVAAGSLVLAVLALVIYKVALPFIVERLGG